MPASEENNNSYNNNSNNLTEKRRKLSSTILIKSCCELCVMRKHIVVFEEPKDTVNINWNRNEDKTMCVSFLFYFFFMPLEPIIKCKYFCLPCKYVLYKYMDGFEHSLCVFFLHSCRFSFSSVPIHWAFCVFFQFFSCHYIMSNRMREWFQQFFFLFHNGKQFWVFTITFRTHIEMAMGPDICIAYSVKHSYIIMPHASCLFQTQINSSWEIEGLLKQFRSFGLVTHVTSENYGSKNILFRFFLLIFRNVSEMNNEN